ncbi:elongation factor 1-gamma-like [Myotis daubentonii]|uniref:elongation factor 1-gamma-like n=1 Tax=Myotis daubentonii TaxID=98922 RepID=UPI002873508D|nr:elongation factor 1-gamma-like [Myotis daubentonii]
MGISHKNCNTSTDLQMYGAAEHRLEEVKSEFDKRLSYRMWDIGNISLSEKKKAAAPAPEEEMDECEQALAAEPKAKDPFAHLPKSTFVLDKFKRKYSNEDTLPMALPYFWEHFDKDGWSRWYAEYRFPEELTQTFMSCNLITGMFQRLDKLRKNAFASVILFGTNNSSSISGVWVF